MSKQWTPLLFTVALAALFSFATSTESRAGEPRTHDGLFLRLSGGFGYGSTSLEELKLSGVSGDINLAIGGIVGTNLALHGTLFGWTVADPSAELSGYSLGDADGDMTMSAFAGGITYYFMPSNIYISPSIGIATLSFDGRGGDGDSDAGFALDITLGKEWWVGNSWGLGIAGAFGYHSIPDGGVDLNWTGATFALRFTATMN